MKARTKFTSYTNRKEPFDLDEVMASVDLKKPKAKEKPSEFVSVDEACEILGVSERTVHRRLAEGRLIASQVKRGAKLRITRASVLALRDKRKL